jgi:predicted RNase H-like HicB family nuclease
MSKTSDRYVKVVAWSEEDQCYIGRCPGLMLGGVHGSDERAVYAELCEAVDELIQLCESEGRPLPAPTSLREIEALVTSQ